MKHCTHCNTTKENSEFHKRSASIDGLSAKCKECQRAYDKARANNPNRVAARCEYAKTDRGADRIKAAKQAWASRNKGKLLECTRRYRKENPNKARAHGIVGYAIKCGNLHAEPCEVCGSTFLVHAHHDDYMKPLNVRWLCPMHHSEWHAQNGEGANP